MTPAETAFAGWEKTDEGQYTVGFKKTFLAGYAAAVRDALACEPAIAPEAPHYASRWTTCTTWRERIAALGEGK